MAGTGQVVGVVGALWRYPVKSMQGERVERVALDASGFDADRRFGVVTPDGFVLSGKSEPRILGASASVRADGEIEIELPHGVRTAAEILNSVFPFAFGLTYPFSPTSTMSCTRSATRATPILSSGSTISSTT